MTKEQEQEILFQRQMLIIAISTIRTEMGWFPRLLRKCFSSFRGLFQSELEDLKGDLQRVSATLEAYFPQRSENSWKELKKVWDDGLEVYKGAGGNDGPIR